MMKKTIITAVLMLVFLSMSNTLCVEASTQRVKSITIKSISGKNGSLKKVKSKKLTIKKGKSMKFKVIVKTSRKKVSKKFSVKSSNSNVVKVKKKSNTITVCGKNGGNAKVYITSKANKKKKKVLTVKVYEKDKKSTASKDKNSTSNESGNSTSNESSNIQPVKKAEKYYYSTLTGSDIDISLKLNKPDYKTLACTGLPEGLSFLVDKEECELNILGEAKGTGVFCTKISYKSTDNKEYSIEYIFVIGSENEIVTSIKDAKINDNLYVVANYIVAGGSGEYEVQILDNLYGLAADEECLSGTVPYRGNFDFNISVTDKINRTISTIISIEIK